MLNMIDHLPSNSFFVQALTEDDEYALATLDRAEENDPSPRMAEWSPEVNLLAMLNDRLGVLVSMFASVYGGKATMPPVPRPRSAASRVRLNRAAEKHRSLVARVIRPRDR